MILVLGVGRRSVWVWRLGVRFVLPCMRLGLLLRLWAAVSSLLELFMRFVLAGVVVLLVVIVRLPFLQRPKFLRVVLCGLKS